MGTYIRNFEGPVIFTQDTHQRDYLTTLEGRHLPVVHCLEGSEGWQIVPELLEAAGERAQIFTKETFGSVALGEYVRTLDDLEAVEMCGVCTGICVLSNAVLLRACRPELPLYVISDLCACVSPDSHERSLLALKLLQADLISARGSC